VVERPDAPSGGDALPLRELLDGDGDRGVALLTSDLRLVYANPSARSFLRDHGPAGAEPSVPAPVLDALTAFRERLVRQSTAMPPDEIVLGTNGLRRVRCLMTSLLQGGRRYFVVRMAPPGLFAEPTVRRLQTRFGFTVREAQVALAVAKGLTNAETALHLGITEKTVKNALMSVYAKCGVRNRVELALKAHDAPFERPRPTLHGPHAPE
jgi:DNA-binding CsgD family transcriptional regulator